MKKYIQILLSVLLCLLIINTAKAAPPAEKEGGKPANYSLSNYPNPFNPDTKIKFELPKAGHVNISVYNLLGQQVATVLDEYLSEGVYQREFNAKDLPGGLYIYKLTVEGQAILVKKMLLLK